MDLIIIRTSSKKHTCYHFKYRQTTLTPQKWHFSTNEQETSRQPSLVKKCFHIQYIYNAHQNNITFWSGIILDSFNLFHCQSIIDISNMKKIFIRGSKPSKILAILHRLQSTVDMIYINLLEDFVIIGCMLLLIYTEDHYRVLW